MKFTFYIITFILMLTLVSCGKENEEKAETMYTNKLINESSPYLLEHAHNPVNWYPWGKEALEKAKKENKPIIISIGYAACHWCHVMEHESFSDPAVAKVMNEDFISIKVDREERPDIDNLYMNAALIQSGHGGWPLNAFALPDGRPFFVGTYFPKDNWVGLLGQIAHLYKNDYAKLEESADNLNNGVASQSLIYLRNNQSNKISNYKDLYNNIHKRIDTQNGGLAGSPKFPMPSVWDFLMQYSYLRNNKSAFNDVEFTLGQMALSGTYDQLGGGFHRYATDLNWKIPHFEKMLYDNAQLISTYSNAYKIQKNPLFKHIVYQTIAFVERELMNKEYGFYSSINADSEGEEGKFYIWGYEEIKKLLTDEEFNLVKNYYNLSANGNWEDKKNIFHSKNTFEDFVIKNKLDFGKNQKLMETAKSKLFEYRKTKIRPSIDDKVITSWNALMLKGLIDAYTAFGEDKYLELALKNADFLQENLIDKNGQLHRIYKNGKVTIEAFLDDYSLLATAYFDLYQVTFDIKWLNLSKKLTEYIVNNFKDENTEFYYYTHKEDKELSAKTMELSDNVIPSSNSVVANLLFDLGQIYYNEQYIDKAEYMLENMSGSITESPIYHANWAILLGKKEEGIYEVAIVGKKAKKVAKEMQMNYLPNCVYLGGTEENLPLLKEKLTNETTIYVCKDKVCNLPTTEVKKAVAEVKVK